MTLSAIALNCTLKAADDEPSSTDAMIDVVAKALKDNDVALTETIRVVDHDVKPGVTSDEGEGDAWPAIRKKIVAADILILATPVWLGQMSSVAKRVLERMDAFLDETDDRGRTPAYGKVLIVAVVGNEDGAHAISANVYQGLIDMGFSVPPSATCYWVGEAMGSIDFKDLKGVPDKVRETADMLGASAAHLARLLKSSPYPGMES